MTDLCRRCPLQDEAGGGAGIYGPRRASAYRDGSSERPLRVAVAAGSPASGEWNLAVDLDWQAALVALATAVVERGGTLVVPANIEVTFMLALAAYPHAEAHAGERFRELAPVQAVETGGISMPSRHLLSPLVRRNVLTYHDRDGELVPSPMLPETEETDGDLLGEAHTAHHPLGGPALRDVDGVVVVHPDSMMIEELLELPFPSSRVAVFGGRRVPELRGWAIEHDPIPRLLEGLVDWRDAEDAMPYGLVMEMLIDRWQDQDPYRQ